MQARAAGQGANETRPPSLLRKTFPWCVAIALVGVVVMRTNLTATGHYLAGISIPKYLLFVAIFSAINLLVETLATWKTYTLVAPKLPYWSLLKVRGAAYLPGMINYHLGQAYLTYLLSRQYGVPMAIVAGATLLVYASFIGDLAGLATLFSETGLPSGWLLHVLVPITLLGFMYLAVIRLRPRVLARFEFLKPLFDAGVVGHIRLMLWRLPHVLVLSVGLWLAYSFLDVRVPPLEALSVLPMILLVSALPITPMGIGTRELAAMELLKAYSRASGPSVTAPIVAAGAAWVLGTSVAHAIIGGVFSTLVQSRAVEPAD